MKLSYVVFPMIAVLASGSTPASAQAPSPAPALYAALDSPESPAVSSSSLAPDSSSYSELRFDAPAKSAAAPAPTPAYEGSHKPFSALGIGVKVGTGGIGFDVATPLVPRILNLRGGAGFFSYTTNFTSSNNTINGTLKLDNAEVMADVFPFKGSFRLSAGVTMYNKTGVNGTISIPSGGTLTNGSNKYYSDPQSPLGGTAALNFGSTAVPRFTFGWGNMVPKTGHVRFEVELGIEYIGTPTVAWNVTGEGCTTTTPTPAGATHCTGSNGSSTAWGPVAPADIAAQQSSMQSDVNFLKVFPIFNLGLSYKFGH